MSDGRWNDDRLDDLASQVRMMAPLATQVATNAAQIDAIKDDVRELRDVQASEAQAAATFRREYRQDRENDRSAVRADRAQRSTTVAQAAAMVAAATITSVGAIFTAVVTGLIG